MIKPMEDKSSNIAHILLLFNQIVIESVDIEYQRFIEEVKAHRVFDFLLEQYTSINYYTFFTSSNLVNITNYVYETAPIRDFIFNVTDRVLLSLPDCTIISTIINHTAAQFTCNKQLTTDELMPVEIKSSIEINKDVLETLLKRDYWLLILFYMIFLFQKTEIYKSVMK